MPFRFSAIEVDRLAPEDRMIEDRRNNPVRNRDTKFRLLQQNILSYTYPFVPGFANPGIDRLGFQELIDQATENAVSEGHHLYSSDFEVKTAALAKVSGDIFEEVEAAIHWMACVSWNRFIVEEVWGLSSARPATRFGPEHQVASLSLPRRYDWVKLLHPEPRSIIEHLRADLDANGMGMPTSTPDLLIVQVPTPLLDDSRLTSSLADISLESQALIDSAYRSFEGLLMPDNLLLGIAFKKSLRSDRLYQPLYEANVMQLLLEGLLGAKRVEFEVHTLESAGTRAQQTYRAASLGMVAARETLPHRAIRELYEPTTAQDLVRRFVAFLNQHFTDAGR